MDSTTYWKQREAEQLRYYITEEAEYQKHINGIYDYMMDQIQKEINGFYVKYAKKEGITLSEAKKRVSKLDIEEYGRKAAKYVKEKDFSKEANDEMRLYNATMKINRLELLKANIGLEMVNGFNEIQKYYGQILTNRSLEEFRYHAGILGKGIQNNEKAAHAIVNGSFHNARYSDRIWMYQDMMKAELDKLLRQGLIQGKHPRELSRHLAKLFGVSKYNAERLMRTELARVQIEAQMQSFERNGYEEYQFLALGTACETCRRLDGKHFKIKDMQIAENAPPMHPNCRCSTAAYMDDEEFDKWLDFLNKGGTIEEWEIQKRYADRREAWKKRQAEKARGTDIGASKRIEFEWKGNDKEFKDSEKMLRDLSEHYKTRLEKVSVGSKQSAGGVNMSGAAMNLSSTQPKAAIHEFAHTIANSTADKYGLTNDGKFWKEIKSIMRKYRKDVGSDTTRWISSYEHGSRSVDEFFAEGFTHAKMRELGMKLPPEYGKDFTYSQQVLETVDKYFKKSVVNTAKSDIIELYRKGQPHRKQSVSGEAIIDKATYHKITNQAIKKGADIRIAEGDILKRMDQQNASAVTYGDIIFFREDATVSDVLEEVHHFYQNKAGMNAGYSPKQRIILNEIEAKEYVLSMADKYNIPEREIELTKNQLKSYNSEMDEMKKRGEWID